MELYESPLVSEEKEGRQVALRKSVSFSDPETFLSTSFFVSERNQEKSVEDEDEETCLRNRWKSAIERDAVEEVEKIASLRPDLVHSGDDDQPYSVLHLAAKYAATSVFNAYLGIVDINKQCGNYDKTTPLYWAIRQGHLETVKFLLQCGALQHPLNVYGDTTVYLAVQFDKCDILHMLLEMGHNPNLHTVPVSKDVIDLPLHLAVRTQNLRAVELLLDHRADCHSLNGAGETSLYLAVEIGQSVEILERLLIAGCRQIPYKGTSRFRGPKLFQQSSIRTDSHDHDSVSPLLVAVKFYKDTLLDVLLKYINDPVELKRALACSISRGCLEVIQKLVRAGAEINDVDGPGGAILATAMQEPNVPVVEYLLEAGADPDIAPMPTWLAYPCKFRNSMVLRRHRWRHNSYDVSLPDVHAKYQHLMTLILQRSSDLDTVSEEDGQTALWILCTDGIVCLAFHLLKSGANVHKPSKDLVTPLQSVVESFTKCFNSPMMKNRLIHMVVILTCFISDWSKEPWIPHFLTNQKQLKDEEGKMMVPEELVTILADISTNPSSLLLSCRTAILKALGINSNHKVEQLGLPNRLKQFILLEDLENVHREVDSYLEHIVDNNYNKWATSRVKSDSSCLCTVTGVE